MALPLPHVIQDRSEVGRGGLFASWAQVRRVNVHEEVGEAAAEKEGCDVPTQQACQATALAQIVCFVAEAARLLLATAGAGCRSCLADDTGAGAAAAARQEEEGDPSKDATAEEVRKATNDVFPGSRAVNITSVRPSGVDAHVVPYGSDACLNNSTGDELRPFEAQDVADELKLVGRTPCHDEHQHKGEEPNTDTVASEEGEYREEPEDGILDLTEDRPVERLDAIEAEGPPPAR
mmetsp:Transcript_156003/g.500251  ORF Transcript_156003/g.500251 Transcript_156003/m.500251 type:complete len:235 (-) Transcript_156003:585-1289(-)